MIMAITNRGQIINLSSIKNALTKIDIVVKDIDLAIESLHEAKTRCGTDVLETNEGNKFPYYIDLIIDKLTISKSNMLTMKQRITETATKTYNAEKAEFDKWEAEQMANSTT